jgi:hypothetical protein
MNDKSSHKFQSSDFPVDTVVDRSFLAWPFELPEYIDRGHRVELAQQP